MVKQINNLTYELRQKLRSTFYYTILFSLAINILVLAAPLYSLQVLDRVISSGSKETLLMLSIIVVVFIICWGIFNYVRDMILASSSRFLDDIISGKIVHTIFDDVSLLTKTTPSSNMRDLETIKHVMTSPGIKAIFDFPFSIIFLIVLYLINPSLMWIAIIGALIIFIVAYFSNKITANYEGKAMELQWHAHSQLDNFTNNAASIKALRIHDNIKHIWQQSHDANKSNSYKSSSLVNGFSNLSKSIRMIIQIAITGVGGYLVLQSQMTPGGMIAASIIAGRVLAPIDIMIGSWKSFFAVKKSYSNISSIIESVSGVEDNKIELPEPKGVLGFEDIYFQYKGQEKPVLQNINIDIKAGEVIALIGPSASGKSTIASLAVGIMAPSRGKVRLDGADINYQDSVSFGSALGYLPQNVDIFSASVKDNIARMNNRINDDDVIKAAKIAGVHEMILHFPQGYETIIGKGGVNLSAGQMQRIALARCFYGNPKLLVLDEPNSNLDEIGDRALLNSLAYAKQNKITTLIITHRPKILQMTDKLIILKGGKIADCGSTKDIQNKYTRQQGSNNAS